MAASFVDIVAKTHTQRWMLQRREALQAVSLAEFTKADHTMVAMRYRIEH
jgi:hypothetical protein